MKFNLSNIIIEYLDSFNTFEHLCIVVAFLEFIFFLIPWDISITTHLFLFILFILIIYRTSKKSEKSKKVVSIFCFLLYQFIVGKSLKSSILSIRVDLDLPIIIAVACVLITALSLFIRKAKKATLKSLIIIGLFSILFTANILYNNQHYISNPQLRNHLHSTIISELNEEELAQYLTSINIGDSSKITNLKDIEKFKNLKRINIDGYINNIEGLFELDKLENIEFWFSDSNILYEINNIQYLKSLTLYFLPSIKEDFILSDMTNLEELNISGNYIGHIDFIGKSNNLQFLQLRFMDLKNVATIKNLKSLKVLELYDVNINNIDGILSNDSIEEIHYRNSNITDYEEVLKEKGIKLVRIR